MRLAWLARGLLLYGLALHFHIHLHHQFKGPPFDYGALALAAGASWVGVPGPGEPVLIAAGILAADHKLAIFSVLVVAFAAAWTGGMVGWLIGLRVGRGLLTAPGPLRSVRQRILASGDHIFRRYVAIAVFLAPSIAAGIHRVRTPVYLFWNTVWAVVWTVSIGLGAFYAGPPIVDAVDDLGWVSLIGLVVLVAGVVVYALRRKRSTRLAHPDAT